MKIRVLSDLHPESVPPALSPANADVVVLAGDIEPAISSISIKRPSFRPRNEIKPSNSLASNAAGDCSAICCYRDGSGLKIRARK